MAGMTFKGHGRCKSCQALQDLQPPPLNATGPPLPGQSQCARGFLFFSEPAMKADDRASQTCCVHVAQSQSLGPVRHKGKFPLYSKARELPCLFTRCHVAFYHPAVVGRGRMTGPQVLEGQRHCWPVRSVSLDHPPSGLPAM